MDLAKVFHPFGLMITKTENAFDHEYLFDTLKKTLYEKFAEEYNPTFLLADAAHASTNGFKSVFADSPCKRIVCWAHVIRAIDLRLPATGKYKDLLRADIVRIQYSRSTAVFTLALRLFFAKWEAENKPKVDQFLAYFTKEWCSELNNGWYEGFAANMPEAKKIL